MYSNEDLERFYFQYQTEALPSGESVQSFFKRNNVSYNIFSKWYKDTRKRIVEVSVDGRPSEASCPSFRSPEAAPALPQGTLRIMVDIAMSNGLRLSQKNLSYWELLRRETISRSPIKYSEAMPSDQKDRYIRFLIERQEEKELELRAMQLAVEEFQSIHDRVVESLTNLQREMAEIKGELSSERSKRKEAESRARKLDHQLRFTQKNRFGDKRQNARKKTDKPEEEPDRNNEKDNFDGTAGRLSTGSVDVPDFVPSSSPEKKERDTSNRSDNYNTIAVSGTPVVHPSDEYKVPGRIIGKKEVKVFSFKMCLVEVEMAAVYHSVISMVKLHGMSLWYHLSELFQKIFNGCRDFFSMTPQNIGLAHSKYCANEHKVKLGCTLSSAVDIHNDNCYINRQNFNTYPIGHWQSAL